MQLINALSVAPDAKDWLVNTHNPRILHVFDHACNLINEHGEVLSIVTPQIGNGPFNLVIPRLRKSSERISALNESRQTSEVFSNINLQSSISTSSAQLNLGDLSINTADAKLWSPRPDWEILHTERDKFLSRLMPLPIPNPQLPNSLLSSLSIALANSDISSVITAAQKLAGLGIGLTPAGDDFILGALLAAWIIHPSEIASVLSKEIANTVAPLTTSLSAAYLNSAGRGEAGILWHNFFDALISGDSSAVEFGVYKILSIGETSGADALAGFIGTFISYAEMEKNHVIPKHI